jgi:phospholipid/cholesterol/gamma-HCH transport system substrate-binding protein
MQPSTFEQLTNSAQELLPRLAELANRLSAFVDDKSRAKWESILSNVDVATREMATLEDAIRRTVDEIPQLNKSARQALLEIQSLARDMNQTSREIRSLSHETGHLVSAGKDGLNALTHRTIPKTEALLLELQRATASFRRFSNKLETDPQMLLLGQDTPPPGPGEPGFKEPP